MEYLDIAIRKEHIDLIEAVGTVLHSQTLEYGCVLLLVKVDKYAARHIRNSCNVYNVMEIGYPVDYIKVYDGIRLGGPSTMEEL